MIKTIKVKKQLRLDELIKHVWDNDVQNERFRSKESDILVLVEHGKVFTEWTIDKCETFTVEVEEEITGLTRFDRALAFTLSAQGRIQLISHDYENLTLGKILNSNNHRELHQVYAMINGKLELVWEAGADVN